MPMRLRTQTALQVRPKLALTQELRQAIGLLAMSNAELADFLAAAAAENPFLTLRGGPARSAPTAETGGGQSLSEYVLARIPALFRDRDSRRIALALLAALDEAGFVARPLREIAADCGAPPEAVERTLLKLQELEPTGLFARSLAECFELQLAEAGRLTPQYRKLLAALPLLAEGKRQELAARCGADAAGLETLLAGLRGLSPRPAEHFAGGAEAATRLPDLVAERGPEGWRVRLAAETLPRLALEERLLRAAQGGGEGLRAARRQALALKKALDIRNRSLLAIGERIAAHQAAFLDRGPEALQPLTMRAVAAELGLHESSVCRIANAAAMLTPAGSQPLRRFFPRPGAAGAAPAEAVIARIAAFVAQEDPARPVSDARIAGWLAEQGLAIPRRRVAKYRAKARIPDRAFRRRSGKG